MHSNRGNLTPRGSGRGRGKSKTNGGAPRSSNSGGDNKPTPVCRDFQRGDCPRGHNCRYSHASAQGGPSAWSAPQQAFRDASVQLETATSLNFPRLSNDSFSVAGTDHTPGQTHHFLKQYVEDSFRFSATPQVYQFVSLLCSAGSRNSSWTLEEGQNHLQELVRGNGILRLGDAIRFPAKTDKPWSFQRGYIPILTYLSSDWVIKSRINTEVNALYGLVHSEFQIIRDTIEVHMRQLMAARNFSEDNRSPLSGKQVFKVIFVTLFEYLTRFREATIKYPDLRSTAEKIAAWFEEWVTALRATPPFNDECATYNEGKKQLIINNIRVEKERVLRIIQRERVRLTHQRATTEGLLTTLLRNFNHLGSNSNLARHPKPDWESSLNNQYPRPAEISSTPTLRTYSRHPKYYYPDGNVIFSIENILFKVYSLQIQADPGLEGHDYESMVKDIINCPSRSPNTPGTSDSNPIVLPDVKTTEFVHLLELVLGRPYDERYIKIITAAQTSEVDRPKYGGRILDAGVLAMRFGMDQLDSWAQSQIFQLLETSPQTHKENWSQDFLIKLALHIHDSRISTYRHDIFGQIMSILSLHNSFRSPEQRESSLDACVNIYKNPTKFSIKLPALFGYVFMVLLEHGSEVWANRLNRDERLVLYAAQADLTYLSGHKDLETDWISQRIQFKSTCSPKCNPSFYDAVDSVFDLHSIPSKAYSLQSTTPGDDLYSIFHVVSARWFFAENCRKWRCGSKCGEKTLAKFDDCVERLLCGFTEKYKHYVRTA